MEISTRMLTSRDELMQALGHAGFVYQPVSENYEETGEISWPKAYAAAQGATLTGDLDFGSGLPAMIDDKMVSVMTIESELYIEDMFKMTTAQVVAAIAAFVAGAYWTDVALA